MWEQSLLAIQALRSSRDRGAFITGKPCSHKARSHIGLVSPSPLHHCHQSSCSASIPTPRLGPFHKR
ncbi:hypothetical protein C0J56_02840 [Pseudomonas fluorescens]|nr:hypothetical protein C0J56_02840 [Pseudomonas fluorescens]